MESIDTHCHLDFAEFDHDRDQVLLKARANGVINFIVPAVKRASWLSLIEFCSHIDDIYYALGLHPMFFADHKPNDLKELGAFVKEYSPLAVGEIGLDFYADHASKQQQIEYFEQQLEIASDAALPVILHVRKAHEEILASLKKIRVVGGIVHAFNGSLQQAERYQSLNFKFGFGGMLTYERSNKLRKLAKELPLETIVLETDSPDMTVSQHHGERNSPEYLPHCLHALAQVREQSADIIAMQTTANAQQIFGVL